MRGVSGAIIVLLLLVGCTANREMSGVHLTEVKDQQNEAAHIAFASDLTEKVAKGNELFKQGDYRSAAMIYQGLLRDYRSRNNAFECAVRTNLCLAHLEDGDRQSFKVNAAKLVQECKELDYLSRETQFVLYLNELLSEDGTKRQDIRIESRIAGGLTEVLKGGE